MELQREGRIALDDRLRTAFGANAGTVAGLAASTDADQESDRNLLGVTVIAGQRGASPTTAARSDRSGRSPSAAKRSTLLLGAILILVAGGSAAYLIRTPAVATDPVGNAAPQQSGLPIASGPPTATILGTDACWESGRAGAITIQLDHPAERDLTIPFQISLTARLGLDASDLPQQVCIPAGTTTVRVPIIPLAASVRRTTTATITMKMVVNAYFQIGGPGQATVALRNGSPPVGEPRVTWLSDLPFVTASSGDKPPNRNLSQDGHLLMIQGVPYAHGIGMSATMHDHDPEAQVSFRLDGAYDVFLSDVGIDGEVRRAGSVVFRVLVDGILVYDSGTMKSYDKTKALRIPVAGAKELRLVLLDAGDSNKADHGDWGGARLLAKP